MSDTAESLLREHLKLCSGVYTHGLVPTEELHWAGDEELSLCKRWYFESDLKRRTVAYLSQEGHGE